MPDFLTLLLGIMFRPRSASRLIMRLEMTTAELWPFLGIVSISYGLSWYQPMYYSPFEVNPPLAELGPIFPTVAFFAYCASFSYGLARLGAIMGGLGGFVQALALVNNVSMFLLIPQLVTFLFIPISFYFFAGAILSMYGYFFWIAACIVDELHRYESLGRSFMLLLFVNFFSILVAGIALSLLALLMGLFGLPTFAIA